MFLDLHKKSHKFLSGIFLIVLLIILDQTVKWYVLHSSTVEVLCNYGIAMGISVPKIIFVVLWVGVIFFVVQLWLRSGESDKFITHFSFILILSGGISNLIDRIYYGCVVDYIPLVNISSFNIADVFITFGAILILWTNFRK